MVDTGILLVYNIVVKNSIIYNGRISIMAEAKKNILTYDGLKALEDELLT